MKLHCLGTAGYHPNDCRHTSCYALPESGIILDAGSGFYRIGELLRSNTLHILLSHAHLDHILGLTFVLDLLATTQLEHLHVYAERSKIEAIRAHLFHPSLFPLEPDFHWHALEDMGQEFSVDSAKVKWFPLEHPGGSVGYRLDWETTSLAYVTDTTCKVDAIYWKEIQGVDWLMHECNFSDEYSELAIKTGHSCLSDVLECAHRARISRLMLTHFNPLVLGADPVGLEKVTSRNLRRTPEQIILATDGLVVDLG
ncbi:MBL fold metallo-hydrolase [Pirellulaceae bacterium SH449]